MRNNRRTRSLRNNRKVRSSKSLRGGMRLRNKSIRKTHSAKKIRSVRKTNRKSNSTRRTRRRRNMKGGFIEYSALPCFHSDGVHKDPDTGKEVKHHKFDTNWDAKQQFGKESCVSLGTDGAENDPKAAQFGFDLEGLAYENSDLGKQNLQNALADLMEKLGYGFNEEGEVVQKENPYISDSANASQLWFSEGAGVEYKDWVDGILTEYNNNENHPIYKEALSYYDARANSARAQDGSETLEFPTDTFSLDQAKNQLDMFIDSLNNSAPTTSAK